MHYANSHRYNDTTAVEFWTAFDGIRTVLEKVHNVRTELDGMHYFILPESDEKLVGINSDGTLFEPVALNWNERQPWAENSERARLMRALAQISPIYLALNERF